MKDYSNTAGQLRSLASTLKEGEEKNEALLKSRAVIIADLKRTHAKHVMLRKIAHIATLVILFQAAFIFQLILDKIQWWPTATLAGIFCCLAVAIVYEDSVRNLLHLDSWRYEFHKAIFAMTGAAIVAYCIFLLR